MSFAERRSLAGPRKAEPSAASATDATDADKIAQTLVELRVDLSSLVTRGTPESGIAHALDR
ncbi:hypothetical protein BE17_34875 [Sorangium cellulosum]|uniref:Uncharacterized protein n=1 Tax=Sorangium cellulosum TaxID=56 RepID=A0A150RU15_SORCE|nr:hypothetical protein BE17_34875 [Sorangium cellulosum]